MLPNSTHRSFGAGPSEADMARSAPAAKSLAKLGGCGIGATKAWGLGTRGTSLRATTKAWASIGLTTRFAVLALRFTGAPRDAVGVLPSE